MYVATSDVVHHSAAGSGDSSLTHTSLEETDRARVCVGTGWNGPQGRLRGRRVPRRSKHGACVVGEKCAPQPPSENCGCLPEPVKSAYGVPSGSATPTLDRTRPTRQN